MIIVSPLSAVQSLIDAHRVSHVVSLLGPDTPHHTFSGIETERHLKLTFHDIIEPMEGFVAPEPADIETLVTFLRAWEKQTPMLIHCWAGISRSTAAAFTAMCLHHPETDELVLAKQLREMSHVATPNRRIVTYADDILNRRGRMVDAVDAIGRGSSAYEGVIFQWKMIAV